MSHGHEFEFDADFLTHSLMTRIDSMAMRLPWSFCFSIPPPILSAAQPVPDELDAARERLISFIED
jgi:hypothetical protein